MLLNVEGEENVEAREGESKLDLLLSGGSVVNARGSSDFVVLDFSSIEYKKLSYVKKKINKIK